MFDMFARNVFYKAVWLHLKDKPDKAQKQYRRVIERFPNSKYAGWAKTELSKLVNGTYAENAPYNRSVSDSEDLSPSKIPIACNTCNHEIDGDDLYCEWCGRIRWGNTSKNRDAISLDACGSEIDRNSITDNLDHERILDKPEISESGDISDAETASMDPDIVYGSSKADSATIIAWAYIRIVLWSLFILIAILNAYVKGGPWAAGLISAILLPFGFNRIKLIITLLNKSVAHETNNNVSRRRGKNNNNEEQVESNQTITIEEAESIAERANHFSELIAIYEQKLLNGATDEELIAAADDKDKEAIPELLVYAHTILDERKSYINRSIKGMGIFFLLGLILLTSGLYVGHAILLLVGVGFLVVALIYFVAYLKNRY